MFAGKKSAQIREILISESAWEEMTCLFAPSLGTGISAEIIFIVPGTCNIAFEFFILNPPVLFIGYCINT
ncbi:hypothetical protein AC56_2027 [Escherichia coli 1-182-04_S3_C3]|nr:hypothetical protein AC56_2027 [Escherichia coli 1-182-04_S3_C3]EZJ99408.1 hypothetical protein AB99_2001 [Escherichia coli 1-182-04_S3_C1]